MKCLVTGAAGFIGSWLSEKLLLKGWKVTGVDSFNEVYPSWLKKKNIEKISNFSNFTLIKGDILGLKIEEILKGVEWVFHLAARPGVRSSWGEEFEEYVKNNILLTQKLLETCVREKNLKGFIYASSSSVYGDSPLPFRENSLLKPLSPYGLTKLAGEELCRVYEKNYGLPVVILRYFTVYGPRQRPDMAFHKFIKRILEGKEIVIFGDGTQRRDFTYVEDLVKAHFLLLENFKKGKIYNIASGEARDLRSILKILEKILKKKVKLIYEKPQKGDVKDTWADISLVKKELGFSPSTSLEEGLLKEREWIREVYGV